MRKKKMSPFPIRICCPHWDPSIPFKNRPSSLTLASAMAHLADDRPDPSRPPSSDTPPYSPRSTGSDLFRQYQPTDRRGGSSDHAHRYYRFKGSTSPAPSERPPRYYGRQYAYRCDRNYDDPPEPHDPSRRRFAPGPMRVRSRSPPASSHPPLSPCSDQPPIEDSRRGSGRQYDYEHSRYDRGYDCCGGRGSYDDWSQKSVADCPDSAYGALGEGAGISRSQSGKKNIDEKNREVSLGGESSGSPGGGVSIHRSSSPTRHASTMAHSAEDPPDPVDPSRDLTPSPTSPPYSPRSTGSDLFRDYQPSNLRYAYSCSSSSDGEPENDASLYARLVDSMGDSPPGYPQESDSDIDIRLEIWEKRLREFAEHALKCYNEDKNNKIKYSFVEVVRGGWVREHPEWYIHMNFYAKAEKQGSEKELVFVELNHMEPRDVTSFHVLEGKEQFLGRYCDVRSCKSIEDKDMDHCYACDHKIRHPIGSKYKDSTQD